MTMWNERVASAFRSLFPFLCWFSRECSSPFCLTARLTTTERHVDGEVARDPSPVRARPLEFWIRSRWRYFSSCLLQLCLFSRVLYIQLHYSRVLGRLHWLIAAVCFCVALCSVCASCVQGSHLRGPALQAIGLEHQGQGPLQMVRRVVLAVQQPRGYSVRTYLLLPCPIWSYLWCSPFSLDQGLVVCGCVFCDAYLWPFYLHVEIALLKSEELKICWPYGHPYLHVCWKRYKTHATVENEKELEVKTPFATTTGHNVAHVLSDRSGKVSSTQ
jgi:hypothetical protein